MTRENAAGMVIIADSREQKPYTFKGRDCSVVSAKLATGDYSIQGLEGHVSIERKSSLDELIGCLTKERARFERELERARDFELFAVVIEAPFSNLALGRYRSKMSVESAMASVAAFHGRYGVPFLFCSDRPHAMAWTYHLLRQAWRSFAGKEVRA